MTIRLSRPLSLLAAVLGVWSCLPEFEFKDDTRPDAGSGGSGMVEAGECGSDDDCPATRPRCDPVSLRCQRCLPENDNCNPGFYCSPEFLCRSGCKSDQQCQADLGSTVFSCLPDPAAGDARKCLGCTGDTDCPLGSICAETTECVPGCRNDDSCEMSFQCCPAGVPSEPGACRLTVIDVENCGSCGTVCEVPANASEATCIEGNCGFDCRAFYQDCDGVAGNGCEVDTRTDPMNCGLCREICPGSTLCTNGRCG